MKIKSVLLSAIAAIAMFGVLGVVGARDSGARAAVGGPGALVSFAQVYGAEQLAIPADLLARINTCNCFSSVTAWQVDPAGPAAEVFASPDVLFAIVDLDIQLPWVGVGEVSSKTLVQRILRSGQSALSGIQQFGDSSGGGFRVGLYAWSHPTAPDFCSGETLNLMYFPSTGVLFAFRFDSSHEC